jgi:hypothetical protein
MVIRIHLIRELKVPGSNVVESISSYFIRPCFEKGKYPYWDRLFLWR